jgi:hypothetical protein
MTTLCYFQSRNFCKSLSNRLPQSWLGFLSAVEEIWDLEWLCHGVSFVELCYFPRSRLCMVFLMALYLPSKSPGAFTRIVSEMT